MNALHKIYKKPEKLVIGLMSGTSADGADAALIRVKGRGLSTRFTQIGFTTFHFNPSIKKRLWGIQDKPSITLEELTRLHFVMGEVFASAALNICQICSISPDKIDLIGSHGHTVAHFPKPKKIAGFVTGATMQIGDPMVIARRTGTVTVGDFRVADIAAGGEGAPLIPYFDYLIFRSRRESRGLLNIGGISNMTVIPKMCPADEVFAFDCGPGNMVVDRLMNVLFNKRMDKDGSIAAKGTISLPLLNWLRKHPFLKRVPPKSTGREEFGPSYTEKVLRKSRTLNLSDQDIITTASAFTAEAAAHAYRMFVAPLLPLNKIIVSGGGIHNVFMMQELLRRLPDIQIESVSDYGVSPDAKEAAAFAILANETIAGRPGNLRNATGAKENVILGKICLP